jgi:hypothetical protein
MSVMSRYGSDRRAASSEGREAQRRGAVDIHTVLLPRDGVPVQINRRAMREVVIRHGFGHGMDMDRIGISRHGESKAKSPGRVAGYVSKYVSKACGQA